MVTQTKTQLFHGTIASIAAPNIFINVGWSQTIQPQQGVVASLMLLPTNRGYNADDPVLFTLDAYRRINKIWPAEAGKVTEHGYMTIRVKLSTGVTVSVSNEALDLKESWDLGSKVLVAYSNKTITRILKV